MLRITPTTFRRLTTLVVLCYALLVLTGGAVRLTDSGLGCPDWPTCYAHHFTAALSYHQRIEDTNRLVTVAVSVVSVLVVVGALARAPRRRDLLSLSLAIFAGLLAQVVLGGLVVLFKLNPYLVALHFLLTLAVLRVALALRARAAAPAGDRQLIVATPLLWYVRAVVASLSGVILIGTLVTGSGPHAGGAGAKRIPVAFRDLAELHSTVALFVIGLTLGMVFAFHQARASEELNARARRVVEVLFVQGLLGFTQYALHDNALVVELHIAGATLAWCTAIVLLQSLYRPIPQATFGAEPIATHDALRDVEILSS